MTRPGFWGAAQPGNPGYNATIQPAELLRAPARRRLQAVTLVDHSCNLAFLVEIDDQDRLKDLADQRMRCIAAGQRLRESASSGKGEPSLTP